MENHTAPPLTNQPVACNLLEAEWTKRWLEVESIFKGAQQLNELPDGYALSYPGSDVWTTKLLEFVVAERRCCPFLTFELVFEPNRGPIWLHLRGAEGVKEFFQQQIKLSSNTVHLR